MKLIKKYPRTSGVNLFCIERPKADNKGSGIHPKREFASSYNPPPNPGDRVGGWCLKWRQRVQLCIAYSGTREVIVNKDTSNNYLKALAKPIPLQ